MVDALKPNGVHLKTSTKRRSNSLPTKFTSDMPAYVRKEDPLHYHVKESHYVIYQALQSYPIDQMGISFNGGKDSIVMVSLLMDVVGLEGIRKMHTFTFADTNPFPEMEIFTKEFTNRLGIQLNIMNCPNYKEGLEMVTKKGVKAVFMGTRWEDPHGKQLKHFTPTTPGWPQMMRVNPILKWSYASVWNYIAARQLQYPSLYSFGYTSIGTVDNTSPNPFLRLPGTYPPQYRHASCLSDGSLERFGRSTKKKKQYSPTPSLSSLSSPIIPVPSYNWGTETNPMSPIHKTTIITDLSELIKNITFKDSKIGVINHTLYNSDGSSHLEPLKSSSGHLDVSAVLIYHTNLDSLIFIRPTSLLDICGGELVKDLSIIQQLQLKVEEQCGYRVPAESFEQISIYDMSPFQGKLHLFYCEVNIGMKLTDNLRKVPDVEYINKSKLTSTTNFSKSLVTTFCVDWYIKNKLTES
eukprot:NODE_2126_length_1680_cov_41.328838_g1817_i0.p1 GENE.NODE_2126_length_1680_cov_41.328838_g1817_i0~~NODE_2126_length_1680_cov_41.328838_g1817_i0.p1  ORF type:complete len:466 (+),score=80.81 NODE_2126_length_1680_cov_41.328838_g1817_i0:106-1503(+)